MSANNQNYSGDSRGSVFYKNDETRLREKQPVCLLNLIANGSVAAFETLYQQYVNLVFTICLRVLKNDLEAQDLLSEIFMEVWQKAHRFDPGRGSTESFLVTIARSRAIDRMRKTTSRNCLENNSSVYGDLSNVEYRTTSKPLDAIIADEENRRVQNALFELKAAHRKMLEASFYDGLTHQQISRQFKLPLGTVKTSIRQALHTLRSVLKRLDYEEAIAPLNACEHLIR